MSDGAEEVLLAFLEIPLCTQAQTDEGEPAEGDEYEKGSFVGEHTEVTLLPAFEEFTARLTHHEGSPLEGEVGVALFEFLSDASIVLRLLEG